MDQHQRELERKASAGDVEAEAALLSERMRCGEVTQEKIRLAAQLGHGPAGRVLRVPPWDFPEKLDEIRLWIYRLKRYGRPAHVRAVLAALQLIPPPLSYLDGFADRFRATHRLAEEWVCCPCAQHSAELDMDSVREFERQAREARAESSQQLRDLPRHGTPEFDLEARQLVLQDSREAGRNLDCEITLVRLAETVGEFTWNAQRVAETSGGLVRKIAQDHGDLPTVMSAICRELVPWALDLGDPVRDRVEARKREAAE